jgi:predicted metal-dependent phosphoesterase TrpH
LSTIDDTNLRKVDFHIHTPQSVCYSDKSVTPQQIVEAALLAGLDAIAITDHNTFENVDVIRDAAQGKKLIIFPGVEISTKSGHFLALFEIDTPLTKLHEILSSIGIKQDGWGDAVMTAEGEAEEIFRKISEQGGLVIAAHIERWPSGFLETKESKRVKMAIHNSLYIAALEITVSKDKASWNNGQMRGYQRKHACIQGSDAHSPIEIGRRPVFIRMNTISLSALRTAFLDYVNYVLFPEEIARSQ